MKRGSTMLYHARKGCLLYPEYLRRLYKQCARAGVRTIALYENNALERRSFRFWPLGAMPADALPFILQMFIHDYARYLEEAGYRIVEVRRPSYPDLFHAEADSGCDGHVLVVATLAT